MPNSLIIANTPIGQDAQGRYCLNDLHRAAGEEPRHKPGNWLMLDQTRELVAEIEIAGITAIYSRQGLGTYVAKELVYAYAMWISAAFHLKVIRAYDAMVAPSAPTELSTMDILTLAMEAEKGRLAAVAQLAITAPKAQALDRIADAEGSMCITDAAKHLKIQPKRLFSWLAANDWIYRRPGNANWIAYQPRLKSGVLDHKVALVARGDGTEKVVEQVLVTAKGLAKLAQVAAA